MLIKRRWIAGCPDVEGFDGNHLVYVAAGSDPFDVVTDAVKLVNLTSILLLFEFIVHGL